MSRGEAVGREESEIETVWEQSSIGSLKVPVAYGGPCNAKTSLMICCPLTTQIKNYPFEVHIGGTPPNAVLADQVKSLDWRRQRAKHKGRVSPEQLAEVRAKIHALIG